MVSNEENIEILKNILYDKSRTCPLCRHNFTSKAIKVGKNRLISVDEDLYAHYDIVNPLLYDIIVCPECSYSATTKNFDSLMSRHRKLLQDTFKKHSIHNNFSEFVSISEAISMHKLALLSSITKKSKIGEQAYIALHISWLYRDLGDKSNERLFTDRAYCGFNEALSTEHFPIQGLDEATLLYMLAAMAHNLGYNSESKKILSSLIVMSGLSTRLKDHILTLKQKILLLEDEII